MAPEFLRWCLSKTMNNRSEVSVPDELLWGHSEHMIKPPSLATRSVVKERKFKRMTAMFQTQRKVEAFITFNSYHTHVPEVLTTEPGP
jgi:hypothetical protein